MGRRFKDGVKTYAHLYDEPEYNDIVKRGDVQVMRPVGGDSPYIDSSVLRMYLDMEDYELGNALNLLNHFKRESPCSLSSVFDTYIGNPFTIGLNESLAMLSPPTERLNYKSDADLAMALRYLGTLLRGNRRYEFAARMVEPTPELIQNTRILVDRSSEFKLRMNEHYYNESDNFITFDGVPLNWLVIEWPEVACNDMALRRIRGNYGDLSEEQLTVWNKLHPVVFSSSDYYDCESVKYAVLYNPSLDMIFVWRLVHKKKAERQRLTKEVASK